MADLTELSLSKTEVPFWHLMADLDFDAACEFLRARPELFNAKVLTELTDHVPRLAQENIARAERLSKVALWLSAAMKDDLCMARAARASGHLLAWHGKYAEAITTYDSAVQLFRTGHEQLQLAITLSSSLQPLMYLGRYDEAFERAELARAIFTPLADVQRIARLDVNLANILHRQDRFDDALVLYHRALKTFEIQNAHRDVATVLLNIAVCSIGLAEFADALSCYERARKYCLENGMTMLAAQADYNIAYLYYLRGDYGQAIELYRNSRAFASEVQDDYHRSLCDLDESEIYLGLGLAREGEELARQALEGFQRLTQGYESAKATAFMGVGAALGGDISRAIELYVAAQHEFIKQQNWAWPALLDLYQAICYFRENRVFESRRSCDAALNFFSSSRLPGKAVLAQLLRALLHLHAGELVEARYWSDAAKSAITKSRVVSLSYLLEYVLGQVCEAEDKLPEANAHFKSSLSELQKLPERCSPEELKVPFLERPSDILEAVIATTSGLTDQVHEVETKLDLVEGEKVAAMARIFKIRELYVSTPTPHRSELAERVNTLRREMTWYYKRISIEELASERPARNIQVLRDKVSDIERDLSRALDRLRTSGAADFFLQNRTSVTAGEIRAVLPSRSMLLEFCEARGLIYAFAVSNSAAQIVQLTPVNRVKRLEAELREQFKTLQDPKGATAILSQLYSELISPMRSLLDCNEIVIVPCASIQFVPFHLLHTGESYLIDDFEVSHCPSATAYYASSRHVIKSDRGALIVVSSKRTEVENDQRRPALRDFLPDATEIPAENATPTELASVGAGCAIIHIDDPAALGPDNPLSSMLGFDRDWLGYTRLARLHIPCELLTISSCGPLLNAHGSGEELSSAINDLMYAGARSVLTPRWNAPDASRLEFFRQFYGYFETHGKAEAFRLAAIATREVFPHPRDWGSFTFTGL